MLLIYRDQSGERLYLPTTIPEKERTEKTIGELPPVPVLLTLSLIVAR